MNESMRRARDAALDVLKPSKKDLERGLELHRSSIVFDAYGFSPTSPMDAAGYKAAIEEGASEGETRDLYEEMVMTRHVHEKGLREEYLEAWEESGVTCVFQNTGEEGEDPAQVMKRHARFTYVTDALRGRVRRAAFPEDVEKAKKDGVHCLYFTANAVPLPQKWGSARDKLSHARVFFQLGTRMMHMTYNRRNLIGDGCNEKGDAGLSDFGLSVVAELNRLGIIPDVAHSGWRTGIETARASSRPVVISHAVCHELNRHCRAKSDEVIRAVVDTGGYIGICGVPAFVGGSGCLDAMLDHVVHVVRKFGADHAAIGLDGSYSLQGPDVPHVEIPVVKRRPGWESFWDPGDPLFKPEWNQERMLLSMNWINWPMFTVGLVQRGLSDGDVAKVIGGNVMRVARESLKGVAPEVL